MKKKTIELWHQRVAYVDALYYIQNDERLAIEMKSLNKVMIAMMVAYRTSKVTELEKVVDLNILLSETDAVLDTSSASG